MNSRTIPPVDLPAAEVDPHLIQRVLASQGTAAPASSDAAGQRSVRCGQPQRTRQLLGIGISAVGSSLPEQVITNADLHREYGMDPDWIEQRTGIRERRRVAPGESTADLALRAAENAIGRAGVSVSDIDLIVVGTFTPDHRAVASACLVQAGLGSRAPAFDVQAACSGFMYALATAGQFVATGNAQQALVIGADIVSSCCDPADRQTAPLFGDGAGAVLLQRGEPQQGLVGYQLGADGSLAHTLYCPAGGSRIPPTPEAIAEGKHHLQMDGRRVYKWAVQTIVDSVRQVAEESGVSLQDIDLFILHQANIRIIDHAVRELGIDPDRVVNNVDRVGNTSAASIPLVLAEADAAGRIHRGDLVLMCGFGAGLTWGTGLFRW